MSEVAIKDTYKFSGHTDFRRRFGSHSEVVGDTESGKSVSFWRQKLWVIEEHNGACVSYLARRIEAEQVLRWRSTKIAFAARGLEKPVKPRPFVCDAEFGGTMQGTLKT